MNIKFISFGSLVYFGIGFLTHLIFIGTTILWTDAFALFVMLLWPAYLIYLFFMAVFWIAIVCVMIFLIVCAYYFISEKLGGR